MLSQGCPCNGGAVHGARSTNLTVTDRLDAGARRAIASPSMRLRNTQGWRAARVFLPVLGLASAACTQTVNFVSQSPGSISGADASTDPAPGADAGSPPAQGSSEPTWYSDVQPIIRTHCGLCHGHPTSAGAPVSLTEYADVQARVQIPGMTGMQPLYQYMAYRILRMSMPPADVLSSMPQLALSAAEKKTVQDWASAGAPVGTPSANSGNDGGVSNPSEPPVKFPWVAGNETPPPGPGYRYINAYAHAAGDLNAPLPLRQTDTDYECFSFTLPPVGTGTVTVEHAVEFAPFVDNRQHIHHALLFLVPSSAPAPEVGPVQCEANALITNGTLMGGYFPGRSTSYMPRGVGIPVHAGDHFVFQVHYDSVNNSTTTDRTGIQVLLSSAPNMQDAGAFWIGVENWPKPILGSDNVRTTGNCSVPQDATFFSSVPHMHRYGATQTLTINGNPVVQVPSWDFNAQPIYDLPAPFVQLHRGDQLDVTCTYNAPGTGEGVMWGETSANEMCFNFMYVYPAFPASMERGCVINLQGT